MVKTTSNKNKVERLTLPDFELAAKLQSRQHGPGIRLDLEIDRIELRFQK